MEHNEDIYHQQLVAEEVAMKMAEAVAILVAPHALVVADGVAVQCVDRAIDGESICEITQTPDVDHFDAEYEFVAEVIEECSSIGRLDVINFWERVIFAWVIGDAEQGMLAFSIREAHAELFSLAPINRLAPLTAIDNCELALSVNNKRSRIMKSDLLKGALDSQSIKSRALNIIFKKFVGALDKWREIIADSELSDVRKVAFQQFVEGRIRLLE